MKVQTVKIIKKKWCLLSQNIPLYAIEDYAEVCGMIRPQTYEDGKALTPDCAFLFAQSATYLFAINVGMDEEGSYYFGYELYEHEGGSSCYPSPHHKDCKKSSTLKGCLVNALQHIGSMSRYYGQPPYPLYVRTTADALRKVNKPKSEAIQLSIFDFLD